MANDFVTPAQLSHLPGAPFTDAEVDGAVAGVRGVAGWHIAPQRLETVVLDVTPYDRWLRLPTLKLVSVGAVRNADTAEVVDPTRYRVSRKLAQVKRSSFWPDGYEAVEVDMTHGYVTTPADLLSVVAQAINFDRRDQTVTAVQIDDYQESFGRVIPPATGSSETLRRYSLDAQSIGGIGIA